MQIALPTPEADESPERFTIRAHRALTSAIPDPEKRNEVVWNLWQKSRGPTDEERVAAETFEPSRYIRKTNVCVFAEHSAVDGQGQPRKYDLGQLARITRACNNRIADFNGFAPISDGHTPNPDDPDQTEPDILGYAGPYRLGMIGRKEPRWAIFEDEFHLADCVDRLAKKPRRSVELWTFRNDPTRSHFDPIAAIGSETPRLPLPVKFSRTRSKFSSRFRDGAMCERYTCSAPSFVSPGATNLSPKKFQREGASMLSNDDLAQIMQAIAETPQFQFLTQAMNAGGDTGADPGGDDIPGDGCAVPSNGGDAGGECGGDDLADLNDLLVDPADDGCGTPPKDEDEPSKNLLGMGASLKLSKKAGGELAVKYSRLQQAHNAVVAELGRTHNRTQALERKAADAERTSVIHGLANKYQGFVDTDELMGVSLYSRGSKLNDAAFQANIATVEKYAHKATQFARSQYGDLPQGDVGYERPDAGNEKYQAKLSQEAVRIFSAEVTAGRDCDYETALAKARETVKA